LVTDHQFIYVQQQFQEFDHFREAVKKWNLNFNQLDSGKFWGEMILLEVDSLQLISAEFNRKFDQQGSTPQGYRTFGIPANQNQSFRWRGCDVNSNNLMIFPVSGEIDATTHPGFKVYTVSIANSWIQMMSETLGMDSRRLFEEGVEVVELQKQAMNILRLQIQYLINQISKNPVVLNHKAFQQIFKNEIPNLLVKNLLYHKSVLPLPTRRIRDIARRKAMEYLSGCTNEYPSVLELCLISGASQRTLEYAFQEQYGTGPKDYIKKIQLNAARNQLIKRDPTQVKIKDVAVQNGFWHMGQFTSDYKKLFGELPSETLHGGAQNDAMV
jgi:AraC family ethanolamine operon transcriptional activator